MIDIYKNSQYQKYYELLVLENKKYNLTSIIEKDQVYVKHFEDSLKVGEVIELNSQTICDVGSGAGFPGIVLKIAYPDIKLTIIEPTSKRCRFMQLLVDELGIKDVEIINERAENIRNRQFDIVVARAVSPMPILLELCIPLVKVQGYFIAMKGNNYKVELEKAQNALKCLNSEVTKVMEYDLGEYGTHSLIKVLKKSKTADDYPRIYGIIKKKPL